jgi:hypothetical protein
MRRTEHGGFVRAMGITLASVMLLGLLGLVGYLLSDINHRRYRLALVDHTLYVEQGRFFPVGYMAYAPDHQALKEAYAPIQVPAGESVEAGIPFEDRSEVDRALYVRLASWARQRLAATDSATLALGIGYVKRLEALPSLSESQRQELRGMRADAAFRQGEGLLQGIALTLHHAASQFALALELGTTHSEKARADLVTIDEKLRQLGEPPPNLGTDGAKTPPLFPADRADAP